MIFAIYYRASDGEIMGWTNQANPVAPDGMSLAVFDEPFQPEPLNERFDAAANAIVAKTAAERHASQLPTLVEINAAVFAELQRTNEFMLDDYPHHGHERRDWLAYRRMLRELAGDAADRINAWALPPDGVDPITALRERL